MKLTKQQKEILNIVVDRYSYTLSKINQVLQNDSNEYEDKKDLLNILDTALAKVWIDWIDNQKEN